MTNQIPQAEIGVVLEKQGVKIHTFISPEAFISNATHIIETANSLIIVDGQFVVPYAIQFRVYADKLGKPISRVYLSHDHPDHFFGLGAAFSDTEVYAPRETIAFLKQYGESVRIELAKGYGDFVTKTLKIPQHEIVEGVEVVDGVRLEHVIHKHTETEIHLSIKLPELGVYIVQDLVYSGAHVYITRDLDNWISVLEDIKKSDYKVFLPGHGKPADKTEIQNNIDYLKSAKDMLNKGVDADGLREGLLKKYPNRTGAAIFDIYLPRLFATETIN